MVTEAEMRTNVRSLQSSHDEFAGQLFRTLSDGYMRHVQSEDPAIVRKSNHHAYPRRESGGSVHIMKQGNAPC